MTRGGYGAPLLMTGRGGCRRWRTEQASLPEGQIVAQHVNARRAECFRHGDEQGRMAIATRAVRQHQSSAAQLFRLMHDHSISRIIVSAAYVPQHKNPSTA